MKDPGSLLNFYRKLIQFRNDHPALTYGEIDESGMHIEELVSFIRKDENEELLVLHNVSDVEISIKPENENARFRSVVFDTAGGGLEFKNRELKLPAYATVILKRD